MSAIDTILCAAVNPGAGPTLATTAASFDSLQVRAGNSARKVYLEGLGRMGTAAGFFGVRSPSLHDNTRGIRIPVAESPSVYTLPPEVDQVLQPMDILTAEISGGAAETDIGWLSIYYEDLGGVTARLHTWPELSGLIKNIKPLQVNVTSSATIGAWTDTLITATEDLLIANTDYAVLGYIDNSNFGVVGIKGTETGNMRIGGPGSTSELVTSGYFIKMSRDSGRPWIPVFNSANKGATSVSVCASTASVAGSVTLILGQLSSQVS